MDPLVCLTFWLALVFLAQAHGWQTHGCWNFVASGGPDALREVIGAMLLRVILSEPGICGRGDGGAAVADFKKAGG